MKWFLLFICIGPGGITMNQVGPPHATLADCKEMQQSANKLAQQLADSSKEAGVQGQGSTTLACISYKDVGK